MTDEYKQWEKLATLEKIYIATHPQHAIAIRDSKKNAFSETKKRFGHNGHNDDSDAFRHCYWSSILARELGFQHALEFTSAHESRTDNPLSEKTMDLHNNFVGLNIGKQFIHIVPGIGEYFESDKELSDRCYKAYKEGKLKISPTAKMSTSRY